MTNEEATPLVKQLVAMVHRLVEENQEQSERLQQMRDEIAVLKGQKARPKFKASKMDEQTEPDKDKAEGDDDGTKKKRPGSGKCSKTAKLTIHHEQVIQPEEAIPDTARFKGYRDVVVQGLEMAANNTRYRLAVWQTVEGKLLTGKMPAGLEGHHFDPVLRGYILYQHHHCHVTQPLLAEQLEEWGIQISTGQIDALLSGGQDEFHDEKNSILVAGLEVSRSITVDDSGARHQGKNGYVTQIGNERFAWFGSTGSKSRINFLELLHAGSLQYQFGDEAREYLQEQGLSVAVRQALQSQPPVNIATRAQWAAYLDDLDITDERHVRLITEGALLGGLVQKGFNPDLAIISDGAGQFAILRHGLCWIHAERLIHKLIPANDLQRQAVAYVRDQVWSLYADLKAYKARPEAARIPEFESRFTAIFTQRTVYATLDQLLKRLHRHKDELLLVLQRPDIPIHTNGSETDIRDFVKKRKVSGGTKSDLGRQCRDTFASLKKTCRKLGISFWQYLLDRLSLINAIPPLPTLIRNAATHYVLP